MNSLPKWLKKHFIPHEENEYRPHALRGKNIRNIAGLIFLLELVCFLLPTLSGLNMTDNMAAVLPAILASLTNEERQAQNLGTLTINPLLTKAAEMKANDMATKGYFAHTSPEGKTPWYWIKEAGYQYQYAGENLAVNFSDSKDVTEAWMNSPTHRANIVKVVYTEVGTGVAEGMYKGHRAMFVAQVYANPLFAYQETSQPIKPAEVKPTPTPVQPVNIVTNTTNTNKTPTTTNVVSNTNNVLGAEATPETKATENLQNKEGSTLKTEIQPTEKVLGSISEDKAQTPKFWQKLLASPRHTTNDILIAIFVIMLVALLLNIFIKIEHFHLDLVTNGLIILAIVGAIFLVNYYMTRSDVIIIQSFDYSNEEK